MAQFDGLIADVGARFNLGANARPLVREVLRAIADQYDGVLSFVEKLKDSGFGDRVQSWLGGGAGEALSGEEAERVFGGLAIGAIARKLRLGADLVREAIGYATPKIVGLLTPGGIVPAGIPASVTSFLTQTERRAVAVAPASIAESRSYEWLYPLILLCGLVGLAYYLAYGTSGPEASADAPAATSDPAAADTAADAAEHDPAKIVVAMSGLEPGFTAAELAPVLNRIVVNFEPGSAEIPEDDKTLLLQAAGAIKQLPATAHLQIKGFTDSTGDSAANLALSQRRADAVRDLLVSAGVAPQVLTAKGYGNADATEGENRQNRRIEFSE